MLMLNSLCESKEVIISRGQQVEIGGSFRIPDVILKSNSHMVEVGTTNKTHIQDYEKEWHKIGGKNHEKFYRIKESIFRFEDKDLIRIADGIADVPENKRSLFKLFSIAVAKKPSLLLDVERLFTGL